MEKARRGWEAEQREERQNKNDSSKSQGKDKEREISTEHQLEERERKTVVQSLLCRHHWATAMLADSHRYTSQSSCNSTEFTIFAGSFLSTIPKEGLCEIQSYKTKLLLGLHNEQSSKWASCRHMKRRGKEEKEKKYDGASYNRLLCLGECTWNLINRMNTPLEFRWEHVCTQQYVSMWSTRWALQSQKTPGTKLESIKLTDVLTVTGHTVVYLRYGISHCWSEHLHWQAKLWGRCSAHDTGALRLLQVKWQWVASLEEVSSKDGGILWDRERSQSISAQWILVKIWLTQEKRQKILQSGSWNSIGKINELEYSFVDCSPAHFHM